MLDPSLLLSEESSESTLGYAAELGSQGVDLFVPAALMEFLCEPYNYEIGNEVTQRFVQSYAQVNEPYMNQEEPRADLRDIGDQSLSLGIRPFRPEEEALVPHLGFRSV
jgi:hypothetical protein